MRRFILKNLNPRIFFYLGRWGRILRPLLVLLLLHHHLLVGFFHDLFLVLLLLFFAFSLFATSMLTHLHQVHPLLKIRVDLGIYHLQEPLSLLFTDQVSHLHYLIFFLGLLLWSALNFLFIALSLDIIFGFILFFNLLLKMFFFHRFIVCYQLTIITHLYCNLLLVDLLLMTGWVLYLRRRQFLIPAICCTLLVYICFCFSIFLNLTICFDSLVERDSDRESLEVFFRVFCFFLLDKDLIIFTSPSILMIICFHLGVLLWYDRFLLVNLLQQPGRWYVYFITPEVGSFRVWSSHRRLFICSFKYIFEAFWLWLDYRL